MGATTFNTEYYISDHHPCVVSRASRSVHVIKVIDIDYGNGEAMCHYYRKELAVTQVVVSAVVFTKLENREFDEITEEDWLQCVPPNARGE